MVEATVGVSVGMGVAVFAGFQNCQPSGVTVGRGGPGVKVCVLVSIEVRVGVAVVVEVGVKVEVEVRVGVAKGVFVGCETY